MLVLGGFDQVEISEYFFDIAKFLDFLRNVFDNFTYNFVAKITLTLVL